MTVSSLAKKIIGVNHIVVENIDLETNEKGEQLIVRARPWKSSQKRCSVCGKECPGFDRGKGLRRWRAPDFGSGVKVFIEAEAPRVRCPEHGVVVQPPNTRLFTNFQNIEGMIGCSDQILPLTCRKVIGICR